LEAVVEKLERGDLPLEESVSLFEQGLKLSNACKSELESAEGRIQVLLEQGSARVARDLEVEDAEEDAVEEDADEEEA
ncbi:MAG: exodeoxyribonuclease VII small subunit, partial [Acidobacteriota bacterium]|nr:exodeoxyribonuclease VII small subunit [Acidobacteriota bacterium]